MSRAVADFINEPPAIVKPVTSTDTRGAVDDDGRLPHRWAIIFAVAGALSYVAYEEGGTAIAIGVFFTVAPAMHMFLRRR